MKEHDEHLRVDRGTSLIEFIIVTSMVAILVTSLADLAIAFPTTILSTELRSEITRDLQMIQTVSRDLTASEGFDTDPGTLNFLPGTNVVTLDQGHSNTSDRSQVISYRYVADGPRWTFVRFALPSTSDESDILSSATIARYIQQPPENWNASSRPLHAFMASSRVIPSDLAHSSATERFVTFTFVNGRSLRVGGIHHDVSTPIDDETTTSAPDSPRCGGTITIVLNTSSNIWSKGAASTVVDELKKFSNYFRGTPTSLRVVSFDRSAISLYPDLVVGSYVDLLNPNSAVSSLINKLTSLSTSSTSWRNGRNWEDGLWQATRRDSGLLFAQVPDLIVFVTDGSPNRNRANISTDSDTTFHAADLSKAQTAGDYARSTGADLIGILIGDTPDSTATAHLAAVFGSRFWEGSTILLPANRSSTYSQPSSSPFGRLDAILGLVSAWRCAGTVTVQQRVLAGTTTSVPDQPWTYDFSRHPIDSELSRTVQHISVDSTRSPSTTVDLGLSDEEGTTSYTIEQHLPNGFTFHSISCTSGEIEVAPIRTEVGLQGSTIVHFDVDSRRAVSCTFTARPS